MAKILFGFLFYSVVILIILLIHFQSQFVSSFTIAPLDNFKTTTFRLYPGEDLKKSLLESMALLNIEAASIVSCVGSVQHLNIRLANTDKRLTIESKFEIVSLTGTIARMDDSGKPYAHLHMSVADGNGTVFGGHLLVNNTIYTTAEITLLVPENLKFVRAIDEVTGYLELEVRDERVHSDINNSEL